MPHPLAAAISRTVDDHARMARAEGDTRPIGQLRAGVLADLVLRPWDTTRPPVTAHLTVIAPLETITTGVAGHDACAVGHLGGCGCAGQRRFVRTRDRTCRHPGCRNDAAWADLDHVIPHGLGGETACENLCCLCRRHHRLKTHAAGWRFVMTSDGVLAVTTPSGVTRITRPPGLAPPDDPAPF
jgi:hypothetical protein